MKKIFPYGYAIIAGKKVTLYFNLECAKLHFDKMQSPALLVNGRFFYKNNNASGSNYLVIAIK